MKRIVIFLIMAILLFSVGFGGGIMVGRTWLNPEGATSVKIEEPGPVYFVGDFIANLSGAGNHVANFKLSLETSSARALEMVSLQVGFARVRNEVILLVKTGCSTT